MLSTRNSLIVILLGICVGATIQLVISGTDKRVAIRSVAPDTPKPLNIKKDPVDSMNFTTLTAPYPGAAAEQWLAFAKQVKNTKTGSRHDNYDYTSPLLAWYVYIARQSPETIYTLYQDHTINSRLMGHLIQFGLLPDWYHKLDDARTLLLNEPSALISLAVHQGSDFARGELISLLRENESKAISVRAGPLLFALSGMQDHEVEEIFSQMQRGSMRIDARSLRRLMLDPRLKNRNIEMLKVMRTQTQNNRSSSRAMSSYLLHGAELGAADYVKNLIDDVKENDSQPTNFYCAACALALVSDGLTGSALIDAVTQEKQISVQDISAYDEFFEAPSVHQYRLSIAQGGL